MTKVAVFFNAPGPLGAPLNKDEYWLAYTELASIAVEMGIEFYIVRENTSYLGNRRFSNSWQLRDGKVIETGPITVDALYNKGKFQFDPVLPQLNQPKVEEICTDKWLTYQLFSTFSPNTIQANNFSELRDQLPQLLTSTKIVKPQFGAEGKGIKIIKNSDECGELAYPVIAQELLDFSVGIPNIVSGVHDFRVVILNNHIEFAYVRTPPKDALLANVAQGGTLSVVATEAIPTEVFAILESVKSHFVPYSSHLYSVDMGFTVDGPKLIELNSQPGLSSSLEDPVFHGFLKNVLIALRELAEQ